MSRRNRKRTQVKEFILETMNVGEQYNSSDLVKLYNEQKAWSTICKSSLGQLLRSLVHDEILSRRQVWVKGESQKSGGTWEAIYQRLK